MVGRPTFTVRISLLVASFTKMMTARLGYVINLVQIHLYMRAVTTEDGDLTPVGTLGFETCKLACEGGRSHSVIHIAQQQKSFAAQQAMALSEIWNKRNSILCSQVGYIHSFINGGKAVCMYFIFNL